MVCWRSTVSGSPTSSGTPWCARLPRQCCPPGQRAAGHRAWAHALSVGVRRLEPTMVLAGAQHVFAGTEHPSALFDAALAASSAAVTLGVPREGCLYLERLYELWDDVQDPVSRAGFTREDL